MPDEKTDDDGENSSLSTKQNAALDECRKILNENFDAFVITVRASDEAMNDFVTTEWHGAISDVMGLVCIAAERLKRRFFNDNEE